VKHILNGSSHLYLFYFIFCYFLLWPNESRIEST